MENVKHLKTLTFNYWKVSGLYLAERKLRKCVFGEKYACSGVVKSTLSSQPSRLKDQIDRGGAKRLARTEDKVRPPRMAMETGIRHGSLKMGKELT